MTFRVRALLVGALAALPACAGAVAEDETADDLGAIAARSYAFTYANPDIPYTATQEKTLQAALHWLATVAANGRSPLRRRLAARTLERIETGDVLLGAVGSARGIDRFHMCMDFELDACRGEPPPPDDRTWIGDEALGRKLESELYGYQWGNRVYFTIQRSTDPKQLARTLVHEVNHVLNRSECSYYSDIGSHAVDANKAFVEEYRAYVSECFFVKDASANVESCTTYASNNVEVYDFAFDLARVVPAGAPPEAKTLTALIAGTADGSPAPIGRLVPERALWPDAFGACPAQ